MNAEFPMTLPAAVNILGQSLPAGLPFRLSPLGSDLVLVETLNGFAFDASLDELGLADATGYGPALPPPAPRKDLVVAGFGA